MADPEAQDETSTPEWHRVVVIGGGNGGLAVAGRLRRYGVDDVVVVEPRDVHVYKPLLSHVAGGTAPAHITTRPQGDVTPKGVEWIRDAATAVDPAASVVELASGRRLSYGQLVLCPGMHFAWSRVPGLAEAVSARQVVSNYELDLAVDASAALRDIREGTVVFVQPEGPGSCLGAGQKPMYQACAYWRATGVLDRLRVVLVVADEEVFGIPEIARELERKIAEYGIELRTATELARVDGAAKTVELATRGGGTEQLDYDVLCVEPPQVAPHWLASSGLAVPGDEKGWIEVDAETLRHPRFPDVWATGDAAGLPSDRSGGALRKQTAALAKNIAAVLRDEEPTSRYNGYTVCPFTVSRGTVVLAEYDHRGRLKPTIPFWPAMYRENRASWIVDRHVFPWLYWHFILQGRI